MASIKPGYHSIREIFHAAEFDLREKAAVEYGDGVDRRRVKVGGLGFNDVEDVINIPVSADILEITVDGILDVALDLEFNEVTKAARAYSFEHAADAEELNY